MTDQTLLADQKKQWTKDSKRLDELRGKYWEYVGLVVSILDSGTWGYQFKTEKEFLEAQGLGQRNFRDIKLAWKTRVSGGDRFPSDTPVSHYLEYSEVPEEKIVEVIDRAEEIASKASRATTSKDIAKARNEIIGKPASKNGQPKVKQAPKPPPPPTIGDWKLDRDAIVDTAQKHVKTYQAMQRMVDDLNDAHKYSTQTRNTAISCCQQAEAAMNKLKQLMKEIK